MTALSAKLAVQSILHARVRSLLSIGVGALAVVLLMSGLAMSGTAHARADHQAARFPIRGGASSSGDVLFENLDSFYGDAPISAQAVAVRGPTSAVPAGLRALPRPGELAVSPAMRDLLRDRGTTLAARYPGRITQIIAPSGLVGPHELVIWIGRSPDQMGTHTLPVHAFGGVAGEGIGLPDELAPAQFLLIAGFLIPLLALLVTCSTIGDAQRDQRMAALRLLGLTARRTKAIAALEAGLLAVPGVAVGLLAFWMLRSFVPPALPVNGGVWPADVPVGLAAAAGLLVSVPVLGMAAAVIALRSTVIEPLAVVRRARGSRPRRRRIMPLLAGTALLAAAAGTKAAGLPTAATSALILLALATCSLGLALGGSVLTHYAARAAATTPLLPVALGAKQALSNSHRSSRAAVGLACVLFVSGLLLSFFPLLSDGTSSLRAELVDRVGPSLLVAKFDPGTSIDSRELDTSPALAGAAVLRQLEVRIEGSDEAAAILVGRCAEIRQALNLPRSRCASPISLPGDIPLRPGVKIQAAPMRLTDAGLPRTTRVGHPFPVPSRVGSWPALAALQSANGLSSSLFMSDDALPADVVDASQEAEGLVVARARDGNVEAARTAVIRALPGSGVLTTGEALAIAEKDTRTFRGLTFLAFGSGLAVAALSLLVATVDQARERRRVWRDLWVIGAPRRLPERCLYVQVAVSTMPTLAAAFGLAVAIAKVFLSLADNPPSLPMIELTYTFLGSVAAPVVAAFLTKRWITTDATQLVAAD